MSSPFAIIAKAKLLWRDEQPYSENFQEPYFATQQGLLEKEQVFICGNRLIERWQALPANATAPFVIAETGFGTGLNFLLTWYFWKQSAPDSARLYYYSCEQFPLSKKDLQRSLSLWPQLQPLADALLAQYPILTPGFHVLSFDEGRVQLIVMLGDVCHTYQQLLVSGDSTFEREHRTFWVDAWYLDGFEPDNNEAMWSESFFRLMGLLSNENTTFATHTAVNVVQERLVNHGFSVEQVPDCGNKKHRLAGCFKQSLAFNQWRYSPVRATPWHITSKEDSAYSTKKVIVLGGGLAGCFMAYALAKRGWSVTLIDSQSDVGCGASGNERAVLFPKYSAFRSPLTELMLMAFLAAGPFYRALIGRDVEGELNGILQFAVNQRDSNAFDNLQAWLTAYPELGCLLDEDEASLVAGVALCEGGLFVPESGWINSQSLCGYLSSHPLIRIETNTPVDVLNYQDGHWQVGEEKAEVLIICTGHQANQFTETQWLPLKKVAGQMTFFPSNTQTESLKIPLCGNGHLLPAWQHQHAMGASFHLNRTEFSVNAEDDAQNIARLKALPIDWEFAPRASGAWGGIRAALPDYLPAVGPVVRKESFLSSYASLATDSRRFIPAVAAHYPGLYLFTGFGSRGLTTIPLCAEWLASQINYEPGFMPRTLVQAISPSRFLRQRIISSK